MEAWADGRSCFVISGTACCARVRRCSTYLYCNTFNLHDLIWSFNDLLCIYTISQRVTWYRHAGLWTVNGSSSSDKELQTSHRTSLNESHKHDPKDCCRGFHHESWHDLCFCLIVWCSLDFILLGLFILKFHKTFESHVRAVAVLALIDGSSQS